MQDLFEMDWSFVVVVVSVLLLLLALGIRAKILRRRRRLEEKRKAKRLYKDWLNSSHMQPLAGPSETEETR